MTHPDYYTLHKKDVIKQLTSNETIGLTSKEANKRLQTYGYNELKAKKATPLFLRFIKQFFDFMTIILILAAILSATISVLEKTKDYADPLIILSIVFLNAMLGCLQEIKAENALEALKKMTPPTAKVIRDQSISILSSKEVVPGDIVLIEAGDFIPADLRLLEAYQLTIDESALTGESRSILKNAGQILPPHTPLAEQENICFSSTIVSYGHGKGIVIKTGMHTEVGAIAGLILQEPETMTPLQCRLNLLGKKLGILALFICGLIFFLGSLQKRPLLDMFMTSVSLAVASIPEGLPIVVTIMLSLGVQRMAKKNTIVRKLSSVETLGSATIICSDKTGTLTQNKMTVTELYSAKGKEDPYSAYSSCLLTYAVLCCDSFLQRKDNETIYVGDSTENAILQAAHELGLRKENLELTCKRVNEIPFDSVRKCMTCVYRQHNEYIQVTKGAFDVLLPMCQTIFCEGRTTPLSPSDKARLLGYHKLLTEHGLRVLAITIKHLNDPMEMSEHRLTFVGMLGMQDPPRKEAFDAIKSCKEAGILPIMITGDHLLTACSIGKELGILTDASQAITGAMLDTLDEEDLKKQVLNYRVYARVSPKHKLTLVKALQSLGHIVAMTGDGVNDAPALRASDIGCAMGRSGTDVAKNASDMILTDDNFATIVAAIKEGRGIYDNIKKSVHFLLSSNIGELITIFLAILLRFPTPLMAIHLLWINLITDSLPAISLGLEPPDADIMKRPPTKKKESMFANGLGTRIVLEGIFIGLLSLSAFFLGYRYLPHASLELGRTMCFLVLSLSQLFHAFNMRSNRSLSQIRFFSNPLFLMSFILCVLLQVSVVLFAPLRVLFHVVPLRNRDWLYVILFSISPILVVDLQKKRYNK
ncbi:MAG: P-type Ca2+ transporter type [Clostridiales bacterium]|nr:P-type Ca2+ transporter type [Clostridiales bacterium]